MTTFSRFPPRLQEAIVSRLDWPKLRPVQEQSGDAILDGKNAVVLAPTAGGKTEMSIELARTPDILASVAKLENGPFTVGFAAETEKLREYARSKLEKKKLDMIIANQVGENRGFDRDDNAVEVFWADGGQSFPVTAKTELAVALVDLIAGRYLQKSESKMPAVAVRD